MDLNAIRLSNPSCVSHKGVKPTDYNWLVTNQPVLEAGWK
jgi:hypothetical protein